VSEIVFQEFEAPRVFCLSACVGRHDGKLLLGCIREKDRRFLFEVYDITGGAKKWFEVDVTNKRAQALNAFFTVFTPIWGSAALLILLLLIHFEELFLPVVEHFTFLRGGLERIFFFIIILGIPSFIAMILASISRSYMRPSIAFQDGMFVLLYRNGLVKYYDPNGNMMLSKRISVLDSRGVDTICVFVNIVLCILILMAPIMMISAVIHSKFSFFEMMIFLYIPYLIFCTILIYLWFPSFFPLIHSRAPKIHVYHHYVSVVSPEIMDYAKASIISKGGSILKSYRIRARRGFLGMFPRYIMGAIPDRSLMTLVYWDFHNIYVLDMTTGRKRLLARVPEYIVSAHWVRREEALLIVTTMGKIYLSNMRGEVTLLRDYGKSITLSAQINNEIYLAMKSTAQKYIGSVLCDQPQ